MRKLILPVVASALLMAPVVAGSSNVLAEDAGVHVGPVGVGVGDGDRDHWRRHHDHDTVIIKKRHRDRDYDHD